MENDLDHYLSEKYEYDELLAESKKLLELEDSSLGEIDYDSTFFINGEWNEQRFYQNPGEMLSDIQDHFL